MGGAEEAPPTVWQHLCGCIHVSTSVLLISVLTAFHVSGECVGSPRPVRRHGEGEAL